MQKEVFFIQQTLKSYLNVEENNNLLNIKKDNLDYNFLLKKIFAHGLEGIVFYELNRLKILNLFPLNFVEKLKWGSRNTLIVNMLLREEFFNISRELRKNGMDVFPVKGILFIKELYENMSMRPMADLDFFVTEDKYNTAVVILKTLGYRESDFLPLRKWEQENFRIALTKSGQFPITVELHKRFAQPGRFELSITDAFENLVSIKVDDEEFKTFNDYFTFLFLIHHLGMHYFNVKMIWLVDLVKFLYKVEINWDKMIKYVEKYKLQTVFYLTMKLLLPYIDREILTDDYFKPGWLKRHYLNFLFTHNSLNFFRFPAMNLRLAQFIAELPLIDNWQDRAKFIKNYLKIRVSEYL